LITESILKTSCSRIPIVKEKNKILHASKGLESEIQISEKNIFQDQFVT
jgi:hypothetical protein